MVKSLDVLGWFEPAADHDPVRPAVHRRACIMMGSGVPTTPTYIILASSWRRRWRSWACRSWPRTSSSSITACWPT
jgi:hypothetical protein